MAPAPILEMRGIRKTFPGVVALDNVDLDLLPGEVHALLGENGAGKSTLIKILAGVYPRDGGTMLVAGEPADFQTPADSLARRIKVVYQELDLVPGLSVAENVFLGAYPRTPFGTVDWRVLYAETARLLGQLGLEIDPRTPVGALRLAEQQLVEIARALSRQAQIMVMDEPTSALSPAEADKLFGVIERLRQRGVGVIYVSHKLEEIYRVADRLTVLRDGRHIVTRPVSETTPHQLVTWMVGREVADLFPKTAARVGEPLLEVRGLSGGAVRDLDLVVRAGEVVAVFGLLGAGVHTVGRLIFGAEPAVGDVRVAGRPVRLGSPVDAIRAGLGLVTENRKQDGLILPLSVQTNLTLAALERFATWSWIRGRDERQAASGEVQQLSIKTASLAQSVQALSGGNQQKVLIARWLLRRLRVMIVAEPTRGVDVGAKAEIYRILDELAHQGLGILVLSTELPEVLGIADRILVLREGAVTGEFSREEASQERVLAAAAVATREDAAALAALGGGEPVHAAWQR